MGGRNQIIGVMVLFLFGIVSEGLYAQNDKEKLKEMKESQELMNAASAALQKDEFPIAEAHYRKAIALNPTNETGKYNLGAAYYGKSKNTEAMNRFKQAASVATAKPDKHRAFHNMGNTYMNEKKYTEAVEAYKNALRNNPSDDETRYNLALSKEMLEKNPPQDDQSKEDKKDQNKENEDKKEQDDKGDNKEGDKGDEKENEDKGDQKDENKEGDEEKDQGKPDEPKDQKEGEGDKPQQTQPRPGQLSPQQVKSLLEAMNNEEEKVQDKINAQKQKGARVKSSKDW
jgi:tetratricopeptide (TPR) repeat protein